MIAIIAALLFFYNHIRFLPLTTKYTDFDS